jgi:hypothetical protein
VLWALWAAATRGGLALRLAGISLCNRDGSPASRWRCAWRSLLMWLPVLALLLLSFWLDVWRLAEGQTMPMVTGGGGMAVLVGVVAGAASIAAVRLVGRALAAARPARLAGGDVHRAGVRAAQFGEPRLNEGNYSSLPWSLTFLPLRSTSMSMVVPFFWLLITSM